jgi:hypothetical protein
LYLPHFISQLGKIEFVHGTVDAVVIGLLVASGVEDADKISKGYSNFCQVRQQIIDKIWLDRDKDILEILDETVTPFMQVSTRQKSFFVGLENFAANLNGENRKVGSCVVCAAIKSLLLTVLLRAAGISSYVRKDENYVGKRHYFVIAILDNKRYKFDAVREKLQFKPTQRKESTDSEILSAYYALFGNNCAQQLNFERAREATYMAITIDPENLLAWTNFPLCYIDGESLIAEALEHLPQNPLVWSKIKDILNDAALCP